MEGSNIWISLMMQQILKYRLCNNDSCICARILSPGIDHVTNKSRRTPGTSLPNNNLTWNKKETKGLKYYGVMLAAKPILPEVVLLISIIWIRGTESFLGTGGRYLLQAVLLFSWNCVTSDAYRSMQTRRQQIPVTLRHSMLNRMQHRTAFPKISTSRWLSAHFPHQTWNFNSEFNTHLWTRHV
jgi:hypothetical protein